MIQTPGRAFVYVQFAVLARIQSVQARLEALRHEQKLQVLLAARLEEGDHFSVLLDGSHNFALVQGPALIFVDELEAAPRGVLEVERERRDLRRRRLGLRLALGLALFQLGRQRDLDALLPAWNIDR